MQLLVDASELSLVRLQAKKHGGWEGREAGSQEKGRARRFWEGVMSGLEGTHDVWYEEERVGRGRRCGLGVHACVCELEFMTHLK